MNREGNSALIKGCEEELTTWNKASFKQVNQKLKEARRQLLRMQNLDIIQPNTSGIREAQKNVQLWLQREEVMWKQRSRIQWLKESDQDTKYFHSRASYRQRRNLINHLKDDSGVWQEGN